MMNSPGIVPSEKIIDCFKKYFETSVPVMKQCFHWPLPSNIVGFTHNDDSSYNSNLSLKLFLYQKWWRAESIETKIEVAHDVISKWGQVKGNKPETIGQYVRLIENEKMLTPIKGVASYSKLLSIVYPEKYAIYDARVAVALNAVQFLNKCQEPIFFDYIPGRNNVTGNIQKRIGFAFTEPFRKRDLLAAGWLSSKPDHTYEKYIALLTACQIQLHGFTLADLEMTLFSDAERLANLAVNSLSVRERQNTIL